MATKSNPRTRSATHGQHLGKAVVFVPLTGTTYAMVDPKDWPRIEREYGAVWYKNSNGKGRTYARRNCIDKDGDKTLVTLQRAVMDAKPGQVVQALNGNPLDCRRKNLVFMSEQDKRHLRRVHGR